MFPPRGRARSQILKKFFIGQRRVPVVNLGGQPVHRVS